MTMVLHLVTGGDASLASSIISQQRREPDTAVTVVLLSGATDPALPEGIAVKRIDRDLTYSDLLDLIFESEHVVTW
jgi:hypothetical protein